jgi:uncharacterized membrane protein YheB (UPF0754 family)
MYDDEGYEEQDEQETLVTDIQEDPALVKLINDVHLDRSVVEAAVKGLAMRIQEDVRQSVTASVKELVKKEVGQMVTKECPIIFTEMLKQVLDERVCITGKNSWDHKEMTIKEAVKLQLDEWIVKYSNEKERKTLVQTLVTQVISEELAKKVTDAVNEVKKETIEQIKAETMKSIVAHTAKVLSVEILSLLLSWLQLRINPCRGFWRE